MSEDATPRFYLGVGAQRCGTTWLARYLDEHPDIGITPFKECHYWTSKYTYHQNLAVLSFVGLKDRLPKLWSHIVAHPGDAPRLLWGMLGMSFHNDALYRSFLLTAARKAAIAGEITPSYATLPAEAIRTIDRVLDRPRYIMLLRNPIDRFVSQISHEAQRHPNVRHEDPARLIERPGFVLRSDYAACLGTYQAVVPEDRLLVLFYEHLFDPDRGQAECDRITRFLGVAPREAALGKRTNERTGEATPVNRGQIFQALRNSYAFVARQFPEDLPDAWRRDLAAFGQVPPGQGAA